MTDCTARATTESIDSAGVRENQMFWSRGCGKTIVFRETQLIGSSGYRENRVIGENFELRTWEKISAEWNYYLARFARRGVTSLFSINAEWHGGCK
jgi:hypothetical protein